MLMQTKPQSALAFDITGLAPDIQLQILSSDFNRSLFSRFPEKLLGIDTNAKTIKGEKYGIKTAILYLMPSDLSGIMLCAMAKIAGCEGPCLFTAGRGAMSNVMLSRLRKTLYFNQFRELFMAQLSREISREKAKAKRKQEIEEAITMVLLAIAGAGLVTLVAWGTMEYVDFMGRH
jgi:hypothetical protein